MNEKVSAFTDESGAFGWKFDKPHVTTHFVIASIIVKESDLTLLQEKLETIKHKNKRLYSVVSIFQILQSGRC